MNDSENDQEPQRRTRLHAALVHFPVSAWTAAALLDLAGLFSSDLILAGINAATLTYLLLWVGLATACVALFAGMLEFVQLPEEAVVTSTASRHMLLMGAAFLCFLVSALAHPAASVLPLLPALRVGMATLGLILMMAGAHIGGRLVVLRQRFNRSK